MKTTEQILTVMALLALSGSLVNRAVAEAVPGSISYQGRVTADGTNFTGAGQFKFALVGPGTVNLSRTATAHANLVSGGSVWTEIPPPYQANATSLYFVEPLPVGNKFYRLHKP